MAPVPSVIPRHGPEFIGVSSGCSWNQLKRVSVRWSHDGEIAVVQGRQGRLPEPLGDGDDRGVDEPEAEVVVGLNQFKASFIVVRDEVDDVETGAGDKPKEARLSTWPEPILDQPRCLRNNRSDDREVSPRTEQVSTRLMIRFVPITSSDEDAGIDEDHG